MSLDYLHCARNHWTDQVRLSNHIPWDSLDKTLLQRYEFYIFRIFSNNIKWVKICVKKLYVYKRKKKPNVFWNVDLWLNKNITEKKIRLFYSIFGFCDSRKLASCKIAFSDLYMDDEQHCFCKIINKEQWKGIFN